ncbi:MAG: helix-turn-helix transcriptional regulator [Clostridia bacterium]|nr:helix-turn-helix transcriptional regulator [Clostridia bacterium]
MNLDEAIRKRIKELVEENKTTLTALCLNSNLTPSTIFDFMSGKSKSPKIITIKKLCTGANITLEQFFAKSYFNNTDEIYN